MSFSPDPALRPRLQELGLSCMLNTEVGAVLAVIRRSTNPSAPSTPDDAPHALIVHSLKSLRSLIFHPHHSEWRTTDPAIYLAPFLDVIQSDDMPSNATRVALAALLKILRLDVFDETSPGARDAIHSVVFAITNCRLEQTDGVSEESVLMRILQVLIAVVRNRASCLLTDHAIRTIVNTCFQVVQQSAGRGDLIQRCARHCMHELVQAIFSRMPDLKFPDRDSDHEDELVLSVYGVRCMVDIFRLLCSLLNVGEVVESVEGVGSINSDENMQLFALVLINSAIELGGELMGRYPKMIGLIKDDLFHHLIHYATCSSPLVLSMICSTVLNLYHFYRRSLKLQLEAFFNYVLVRIASGVYGAPLQEVAIEGMIGFCRQPTFVIEAYVNYDCDPIRHNVFEELGKVLCKTAFPAGSPLSPMQIQAFQGLVTVINSLADGAEVEQAPERESYEMDVAEFKPFWVEKCSEDVAKESWVDFVRMRKLKKKKIMIAANHYNRDDKKGLQYLNICHLVPTPPDAKSLACFFRYTPGLDKNKIGEYLGDPDELNLRVLSEFAELFDFSGVVLDTALRTFLETFRLPGESQKIQRILEAFSERFYEEQSSEIFANKDAVFILCYSLIMLNTDQHNPQVKKKMTEDEFIRNNRAINNGADLPREYLSELFHSISSNAITLFGSSGIPVELTASQWADLVKRSKTTEPYVICDYKHKLCREAFVSISGPSVATLSAIFEHTDDEEMLHECVEGLISIARIARYGLEDILDELLSCFCKFTTLLNPYATAEETVFTFSNELKPRMATLAVFTIANKFGESIRGAWRNMVDCMLKLKRLKLLPQPVISDSGGDEEAAAAAAHDKLESGVIFPSSQFSAGGGSHNVSGLIGRFSQFLSLESSGDSMLNTGSEFENNLKIIQQCKIGNIFSESSRLPDEPLQNLGRALIFAAAGKGQKFSTPVEEEETVGFCWELVTVITVTNIQRFITFWPQFHDCFNVVSQFPFFSPCPFAEKAIVALFKIALKLFSSQPLDRIAEELIFKSINQTWKLDKEILDTCYESIANTTIQILNEYPNNVQTLIGWKTLLHLLSVTGRHPETYDDGVGALIKLMSDGTHITRYNYPFCIEAAFGFAALKISPPEKSSKILELMGDSMNWLIQWHRNGFSDPGSGNSNNSLSSMEEFPKGGNVAVALFGKLAEVLRKTSLVRREEIRNQAVAELRRCFVAAAEDLDFTPSQCLSCFNQVIFAMVDDLQEKMLEYSQRENSERERKSMEGTLKEAMELLVDVYLRFMEAISGSPGFRTFWLGVLRRMDTCMKANVEDGEEDGVLQELVTRLLRQMIVEMKEKEVLVQDEENELWEITNIQIQWIAPSLKEDLFPEPF